MKPPLDLPYPGSVRTGPNYAVEMSGEPTHRATTCLRGVGCAIWLPAWSELYRDWHRVGLRAFTGVCGCRVEVLLSNRPLGQQASLFDELETPESLTTG